MLLVGLITGCGSTPKEEPSLSQRFARVFGTEAQSENISSTAQGMSGVVSEEELQLKLMNFADQFAQMFWQEADQIRATTGLAPDLRTSATYGKVVYASAAVQIASGRYPSANLLDMVTLVTLGRIVLEEYWLPKYFGSVAEPLLAGFIRMEQRIWSIAADVLSPEQLQALNEMILQWRQDNPTQVYVADIRLIDFSRVETGEGTTPQANGLFADLDELAATADQTVLLAERMMYYLQKLPGLISLESQLLLDQLAISPITNRFLDNTDRIATTAEDAVTLYAQLPAFISQERQATLNQLTHWLSDEQNRIQGLLQESQLALVAANTLANSVNTTVGSLDTFMAQFDTETRPFDIRDYIETAEKATISMEQLAETLIALDTLIGSDQLAQRISDLSQLFGQVEDSGNRLVVTAAVVLVSLFLTVMLGTLGALLLYRLISNTGKTQSKSLAE